VSPLDGGDKERELTARPPGCKLIYTMTTNNPITDVLKQAVAESGMSFLGLEKETGVLRQTLMRFAKGKGGINIDAIDKLAVYFGFELTPRKTATKAAPKRNGK
jgi:hypothetical protein